MGLAFLITTESLRLLSERKVLKESEYTSMLDAAGLLEAARQEGERITRQAARQAEDSRRRGYREGFAAGRAEHAQRLLTDAAALQQQLAALRTAMAQIVVKGVAQFVGETEPGLLIGRALERVDALIRDEQFLSIRVAPGREALVRAAVARWHGSGTVPPGVAIQADPALQGDDCIVQSPSGTLEIGLAAQLEAFRRAIEQPSTARPGAH